MRNQIERNDRRIGLWVFAGTFSVLVFTGLQVVSEEAQEVPPPPANLFEASTTLRTRDAGIFFARVFPSIDGLYEKDILRMASAANDLPPEVDFDTTYVIMDSARTAQLRVLMFKEEDDWVDISVFAPEGPTQSIQDVMDAFEEERGT